MHLFNTVHCTGKVGAADLSGTLLTKSAEVYLLRAHWHSMPVGVLVFQDSKFRSPALSCSRVIPSERELLRYFKFAPLLSLQSLALWHWQIENSGFSDGLSLFLGPLAPGPTPSALSVDCATEVRQATRSPSTPRSRWQKAACEPRDGNPT